MARKEIFSSKPREAQVPRNLRHNAREAAEYLTGLTPTQADDSHTITRQKYGRGAAGESSTEWDAIVKNFTTDLEAVLGLPVSVYLLQIEILNLLAHGITHR
jgi:hypothetical protein